MEKMSALERLVEMSGIVFFFAAAGIVDYLDRCGFLRELFPTGHYFAGVVLFLILQIVPVILPDLATVILSTAIIAGYIGWRIGRSKNGDSS